jgi:hypothetical protein
MKRVSSIVFALLVFSSVASAQTPAAETIRKSLLAAPSQMKEGATVIQWKADYTYETLKKGTNRLVCFDRSGLAGQQPFAVECTSVGNLERVAQNLKFEAIADPKARQAAIEAAEKAGTWTKPEFGSVWYRMNGPDEAHTHLHITIAVPGATSKSLGLPEDAKQGGVWIMNAGTSAAHLMTPGS